MYGNGPLNGFRVRPTSIHSIRHCAEATRCLFELTEPAIDVEALLEKLADWGLSYEVVDDDYLPRGVEACYVPEELTIYLTETTYQAARRGEPRARFTVVHELGHAILGHRRTMNRESGAAGRLKEYEDSEWQANQFAAETLMPLGTILSRRLTNTWQLQQAFGVSHQAAEKRLRQLRKRGEIL